MRLVRMVEKFSDDWNVSFCFRLRLNKFSKIEVRIIPEVLYGVLDEARAANFSTFIRTYRTFIST